MKLQLLSLLFLCSLVTTTFAQVRYLDSLFQPVESQNGGIYGQADALNSPFFDENSTSPQDLLFDVYEPQGDTETNRPCIVYAHGGAFLAGSREDDAVVEFCKAMASRGYVVMSIDYRLGFNVFNTASSERAVYRGGQDFKAAVRYVKENATGLGIDTTKVFAAGNSAGGLSAINSAYFDEYERVNVPSTSNPPDLGCISCTGNVHPHSDIPQAVVNLWGAIADTSWIEPNNSPLIAFHGTSDNVVAEELGSPFNSPTFPAIYGSKPIFQRLQNLGITAEYDPFYGAGHEPWGLGDNAYFDTIVTRTSAFLYQYFINTTAEEIFREPLVIGLKIYPVPTTATLNIDFESEENQSLNILVVNTLGQRVLQKVVTVTKGQQQLQIAVDRLNTGMYYLVVEREGRLLSRGFVKQ